jgi:hypothetical protein
MAALMLSLYPKAFHPHHAFFPPCLFKKSLRHSFLLKHYSVLVCRKGAGDAVGPGDDNEIA